MRNKNLTKGKSLKNILTLLSKIVRLEPSIRKDELPAFYCLLVLINMSCNKFLDIEPPKTELVTETVFSNNNTATAALTAIYSKIVDNNVPYTISFNTGLYGDELLNYSTNVVNVAYYTATLDPVNYVPSFWKTAYASIYQANTVIEGCVGSTALDVKVKTQLIAEAKFIRAYWYFYLTNFYGDVPLIISTNYTVNGKTGRAPKSEVYKQIKQDLIDAQTDLSSEYVDKTSTISTIERVRPNKAAATALLARVYLFQKDYPNAANQATMVIDNKLYDTVPLSEVFLKNSKEAIWQIPPSSNNTTYNTQEGRNYILTARPNNSALSTQILNAFESGDKRKENWVDTLMIGTDAFVFPFKYKVKESSIVTEYSMALRLAEQYLIRAESRAQQGDLVNAAKDLNIIRHRAGLSNTNIDTKEKLLESILHERQVELFTEWGHRWLDLKRTNTVNVVMEIVAASKGSSWEDYKQFWPIPQTDITNNPNLKQTDGYN